MNAQVESIIGRRIVAAFQNGDNESVLVLENGDGLRVNAMSDGNCPIELLGIKDVVGEIDSRRAFLNAQLAQLNLPGISA